MATKQKPYEEMTVQELATATAEFDEEMVVDTFKPLSAKGKAQHDMIRPDRTRLDATRQDKTR